MMVISLHLDQGSLEASLFANQFVLLRPGQEGQLHMPALGRAIFEHKFPFVEEVIATPGEVCLKFNDRFRSASLAQIERLALPTTSEQSLREPIRLPVWLSPDEPDWPNIEEQTGFHRDEYTTRLLEVKLQVAMIGFLPGFVYLEGLPKELQVPRKETPDRQTAPGSLAIGGTYAGIYSLASPAGWHVVGSIPVRLLQTDRLPPLPLQPGDQLQLESIAASEHQKLSDRNLTLQEYHGIAHLF